LLASDVSLISGFGLAMSGISEEGPCLPRPNGEGDARKLPQLCINHNCFNSFNDVFAWRLELVG
jgi:hypothetical protein